MNWLYWSLRVFTRDKQVFLKEFEMNLLKFKGMSDGYSNSFNSLAIKKKQVIKIGRKLPN